MSTQSNNFFPQPEFLFPEMRCSGVAVWWKFLILPVKTSVYGCEYGCEWMLSCIYSVYSFDIMLCLVVCRVRFVDLCSSRVDFGPTVPLNWLMVS